MRIGAGDYLAKPFEPDELPLAFLRCRALRQSERRDQQRAGPPSTSGDSNELFFGASLAPVTAQLAQILAAERRLERNLPPILIEGETGTGKSVLARWIHQQGPRAARPFIAINCAALPDTLVESELFGHERGAFTDAKTARLGLFEAADGGTLFLDEISALTPATQAKVLTAVEEGRIRRLGSNKEISIDTRLLAASNRPLAELVESKLFREDLYHRLHLLRVTLPPLRERRSDLIVLAQHLLKRLAIRHRRPQLKITSDGEARLLAQPWRGNIRELAHELERAVIFTPGNALDFSHLSSAGASPSAPVSWRNPAWTLPPSDFTLDSVVDALIAEALRETNGNVSAAARRLGVTREYLRYRLTDDKSAGAPPAAAGSPPPT
jgi:DNA-binding NtrC family response regulator